jgi:hypothetical protein
MSIPGDAKRGHKDIRMVAWIESRGTSQIIKLSSFWAGAAAGREESDSGADEEEEEVAFDPIDNNAV